MFALNINHSTTIALSGFGISSYGISNQDKPKGPANIDK